MNEDEKLLSSGIKQGSLEKVATALSRGARMTKVYGQHSLPALMYAIKKGNEDIIMTLIEYGANVNETDDRGWSPLYYACYLNNYSIAELLLYYNANPNQSTLKDMTPLNAAIRSRNPALVKLLLHYNADPNEDIGQHPLNTAIGVDQPEILTILLDRGANPNKPVLPLNHDGPPLFYAIQLGSFPAVQILVNKGANIKTSWNLFSVISYAVEWMENSDILRFLCEKGADVNYQDPVYKSTALMTAVRLRRIEAVRILCEFGANQNLISASGKVAADYLDPDTNVGNQMLEILNTCGITDPHLPAAALPAAANRNRSADPSVIPILNEDPSGGRRKTRRRRRSTRRKSNNRSK